MAHSLSRRRVVFLSGGLLCAILNSAWFLQRLPSHHKICQWVFFQKSKGKRSSNIGLLTQKKTGEGESSDVQLVGNNKFEKASSGGKFLRNTVLMKYCDGGSFSGNNATVNSYNNQTLYFRGFRILQAIREDLFNNKGLKVRVTLVWNARSFVNQRCILPTVRDRCGHFRVQFGRSCHVSAPRLVEGEFGEIHLRGGDAGQRVLFRL